MNLLLILGKTTDEDVAGLDLDVNCEHCDEAFFTEAGLRPHEREPSCAPVLSVAWLCLALHPHCVQCPQLPRLQSHMVPS